MSNKYTSIYFPLAVNFKMFLYNFQVATNDKMSTATTPFLCSDKKSLHLPSDMPALQFDYTLYFYPGQEDAKGIIHCALLVHTFCSISPRIHLLKCH